MLAMLLAGHRLVPKVEQITLVLSWRFRLPLFDSYSVFFLRILLGGRKSLNGVEILRTNILFRLVSLHDNRQVEDDGFGRLFPYEVVHFLELFRGYALDLGVLGQAGDANILTPGVVRFELVKLLRRTVEDFVDLDGIRDVKVHEHADEDGEHQELIFFTRRSCGQEPIKKLLQRQHVKNQLVNIQLLRRSRLLLTPFTVSTVFHRCCRSRLTALPPLLHPILEPLVQVECVRPHERRVVPRVTLPRRVPEVREVQEAGPAPGGEEYLLLVRRLAFLQQPLDEHQRLERHHPVARLVEATRDRPHARAHKVTRVVRKPYDLPHVSLLGWILIVARGLHDRYF
ncbi:hypothetical protein V2J09_008196 [Rumex salicifolius]